MNSVEGLLKNHELDYPDWESTYDDAERKGQRNKTDEKKKNKERAVLCDLLAVLKSTEEKYSLDPKSRMRILLLDGPAFKGCQAFFKAFPHAELWVPNPNADIMRQSKKYKRLIKRQCNLTLLNIKVEDFALKLHNLKKQVQDESFHFDLVWLDMVTIPSKEFVEMMYHFVDCGALTMGGTASLLATDICERKFSEHRQNVGAVRMEVAGCVRSQAQQARVQVLHCQTLAQPAVSGRAGFPLQIFPLYDMMENHFFLGRNAWAYVDGLCSQIDTRMMDNHLPSKRKLLSNFLFFDQRKQDIPMEDMVIQDVDVVSDTFGHLKRAVYGPDVDIDAVKWYMNYYDLELHNDATPMHYGLNDDGRINVVGEKRARGE